MKKVVIGLLIGNVVHFGMREAGSFLKASRDHECRHSKTSAECKDATLVEKALLFELDLGSKAFGD